MSKQPEVWLRGPVSGVPALLQPVAHALLQAAEEVDAAVHDFPADRLWVRPAGVAPVGFHLRHLTGVLDRLFTYARGEQLSETQRAALKEEAAPDDVATTAHAHEAAADDVATTALAHDAAGDAVATTALVAAFRAQVERAIQQLRDTDERVLADAREVGRKRLPSTVLGLLFHAAEHTQRHVGQLIVTARIVENS